MIRKLLMILTLLAPFAGQARADWTSASASAANNSWYCSRYNDPSQCAADRNCKYDWLYRACISSSGGNNPGGGGRSCSSYDRDPYLCDQQPSCQFDYNYNRCADRGQGGGGDQCDRWSNDPFTCNNVRGCGFDTIYRRCVSDYGNGNGGGNFPGNGNGGQSTTVNCSSLNYGYQRCPVYGSVTGAALVNEQSFGACQQGSTWGYDVDGLWVTNGCSGNFQVYYNAR